MAITLQELARLAGVTHTTVSLVLSGKYKGRVSEAKRNEILLLVKKHNYQPNIAARGLVQGRTYRIALCIHGFLEQHPPLGQFSFYEALAVASRRLQVAGYKIELIETNPEQPIDERSRILSNCGVDGHILIDWPADDAEKVLISLKEKHIPAAALGTVLQNDNLTWSDVDRAGAIRSAASTLMAAGHETVAFLDVDSTGNYRRMKEEAFLSVLREKSGKDAQNLVFTMKQPGLEEAIRITGEAIEKLPDTRAFVLTDNFHADAVLYVLRTKGLNPGQNCNLIGLGDAILADRTQPRLTYYGLMITEQSTFVIDALLEEIKNPSAFKPRHALYSSTLIQGETY